MLWEEIAERSLREQVGPETILREEVQKAVLTYFSLRRFFNEGVFQGGTSLRLFYGNIRYSEDLDFSFVIKNMDSFHEVDARMSNMGAFVSDVFPFLGEISLKEQKRSRTFKRFALRFSATEQKRVLRVNIEFANVPSYDNSLLLLQYPPFNPAVRVESRREVLADKVVAIALRDYVKGRDLWDIHFLAEDRGVAVDLDLVHRKVVDYGSDPAAFGARLAAAVAQVRTQGKMVLEQEMERFLPRYAAGLYREAFPAIAGRVADLLETDCLKNGPEVQL
ncbi:MAG: nucleotidyl transferase AbiEii/AbiGii toxin family protein [Ammonifex sp.]|jgi:predicted nucleotidyltransferase component of viral defense system|nr:MAG: nucleotidyl transferase AbiEii/AbiGii toxin family protein [Ammonifex sp.]